MQLTISNLNKEYSNGVKALQNLDLSIKSGMFGLLGPNGAGKSTLMRTLATLQEPDNGEVWLDDINVLKEKEKVKQILGYLPQEFGLYKGVTAENLMVYFARMKNVYSSAGLKKTVHYLLEKVNLYSDRKKHVNTFSGGMKQRLGIALTLTGDPSLIIVDEPTAGLDPAERVRFNNLLSDISQDKIVVLSTHIVDDVSDLCAQMAIMDKGRLKIQGRPSELLLRLEGKIWEKQITKEEYDLYEMDHNIIYSQLFEGNPLIRVFSEHLPEEGFRPSNPCLEDLYFSTIKNIELCGG
ncbi:MAG: ABC transporter ATP-binding protein [Bacteroidales bacterium]|nr:ABC transporter ATP-binding protein [Bacteroidales bacterium]